MSIHKYYYLCSKIDPRAATVSRLGDYVENIRAIRNGTAIGSTGGPVDVPLAEDGGDMLVDLIGNVSDALIMSEKAAGVLSEAGVLSSDVEIVPIRLLDRRGCPIPKEYSIINPLRQVNCLDVSRSDAVVTDEGEVLSLYSICIHEDKVPDDARFFRIGEFPAYVLVRSDLLQALQDKGLQGLRAVAMGEEVYE
jgi:hypothetical protein